MAVITTERFLVTLSFARGGRKRLVWDGREALAMGHPFKWALERLEEGVRFRKIEAPLGKTYDRGVEVADEGALIRGARFNDEGVQIWVQKLEHKAAVFQDAESSLKSAPGSTLQIFTCLNKCIVASRPVAREASVSGGGVEAFDLRRESGQLHITAKVAGLQIELSTGSRFLAKAETFTWPTNEVGQLRIRYHEYRWLMRFIRSHEVPESAKKTGWAAVAFREDQDFQKTSKIVMGALSLMLAISLLIPNSEKKEEELIPTQFTKIIMAQTPVTQTAQNSAPTTGSSEMRESVDQKVTKARDASLVRAFRAKALQNSITGLIKGGVTEVLKQSQLLIGSDPYQSAKRMIDHAKTGLPSSPLAGSKGDRAVTAAQFGGRTANGSAGYGQGARAQVEGQGSAFVDLDLGASTVEEGLSKEEVGKVIHAHLSEIRYCYESSMIRSPDLEGKLILDFTISTEGTVGGARVKESSLGDPRLDDCVIRRLTKWKFPQPKGGVSVAVSYPFIFKTLGR